MSRPPILVPLVAGLVLALSLGVGGLLAVQALRAEAWRMAVLAALVALPPVAFLLAGVGRSVLR